MAIKKWIPLACLAVIGLVMWRTPAASQEELDPLKVAGDTHTLLLENPIVRVISAKVPPGKIERKHKHPRGVTVYLADYEIEQTTFPSGAKNKAVRKFGTVVWSEPVVHEVKNIGKTAMHSIRIELK
ncbi:MAG: hypothetical protein FJW39_04380 [Acidobacteria bacterium]|nr:hypothetical protein [Acidobacteriota bacterium]